MEKDYQRAVYWYNKAAERGNANAQYNLGYCYNNPVPYIEHDLEKSVYWYTKAAEQGDPIAMNYLGEMYSEGEGIPKDPEKAEYWQKKLLERVPNLHKPVDISDIF